MGIEPSWIAAGCGFGMLLIAILAINSRSSSRYTELKAESSNALQEAAEASKDLKELTSKLETERDNSVQRLAELRAESIEARDGLRREFGETGSALRTTIHHFETWSRDEFVRKKSFEDYLARAERGQEQMIERVEGRLERIEKKLDDRDRRDNG